jgi:hypothetical protein
MDVFNGRNFFPPFPSPHLVQAFDFIHWYSRHLAIRDMALLDCWRGRHQRLSPRFDQQWELQGYCALPPVTAALRCSCCGKVSVDYVPFDLSLLTLFHWIRSLLLTGSLASLIWLAFQSTYLASNPLLDFVQLHK